MSLTLNTIAPKKGSRTKRFRIGRGAGSGSGKTAGRGTKGQRSRSGGSKGLKLKGLKQMLLGFPKVGGFQSRYAKAATVSLGQLERFENGSTVDLTVLKNAGLARRSDDSAKIVGGGAFTKKLTFRGLFASASARKAVEAAGGSFAKKDKKAAKAEKAKKDKKGSDKKSK